MAANRIVILMTLLLVSGALWRCGSSSSDDAENPSASTFSSPSGTVTDANATAVSNEALDVGTNTSGNVVEGLTFSKNNPLGAFQKSKAGKHFQQSISVDDSTFESCFTGTFSSSKVDGTLDIKCLSDAGALIGCTGSGTMKISGDGNLVTIKYEDFSLNCSGVADVTCKGESKIDSSEGVTCSNITCTTSGVSNTDNSCIKSGEISVDGEGGNVVCTGVTPNSDCSSVCINWREKDADVKTDCTVLSKSNTCPPSWNGIIEVSSCVLTKNATCN